MAENASLVKSFVGRQLAFELDNDTPVPAAEVLIDLKESAARRRQMHSSQMSPRRRRSSRRHGGVTGEIVTISSSDEKRLHYNFRPQSSRSSITENDEDSDAVDGYEINNEAISNSVASKSKRRKVYDANPPMPQLLNKHLKMFLRLPKALSWCCYEWLYSDIDRCLFLESDDFVQCLSETFPALKTQQMTRIQWRMVRRLIGKPRRCSSAFFAEERSQLASKRTLIRQLQQQMHQGSQLGMSDFKRYHNLPENIPTVLTLGTRVIAWLSTEKDKGFFTGTIEAVDLQQHHYWITFDRRGIGKHAVPDTNVMSVSPPEMVSLTSMELSHRSHHLSLTPPRPNPPPVHAMNLSPTSEGQDPFLTSSPISLRVADSANQPMSLGGFPVDFLKQVMQMSKLLALKRDRVGSLSNLNTEAEKMRARHMTIPQDFQRQYAAVIVDLDDINRQLNMRSESIKRHCSVLGYDDAISKPMSADECLDQARAITDQSNCSLAGSGSEVKDDAIKELISRLTGLLLQIEMVSQPEATPDLSHLQSSIAQIQSLVNPENTHVFHKCIETPLALIQSGMNPSDSLHPFFVSRALTSPPPQLPPEPDTHFWSS